jgi:transcriptional regulator with XRE-family HTH domain
MDTATTLGAHIARLRRERGLSQEELAAALAVTRSIISAWENDNRVPRPDKLAALREVIGLPDEAMASPAARDKGVLPERMPVSQVLRQAADGLIAQLSEDQAVDGRPGYGWRRDLEDIDQPLSAMATAYGLQAILLAGTRDWRVDLRLVREVLRRLELPEGGWSALDKSPLARPEVTAVVIGALTDAGESREYIAERMGLLVETLDRRVAGAERARPYVLTTSLLELSRLDVPEATARRFLDVLVDLSIDDDGLRGWPVVVRDTRLGSSGPSTVHTAAAVRTLAAWASRLDDDQLWDLADSGRMWLERHAELDLGLDDETLRIERADGGEELHVVRHFTPAVVLRALVEARGDVGGPVARQARHQTLAYYVPTLGLWRWPSSGGQFPVWMSYQGIAALRSWGLAHALE